MSDEIEIIEGEESVRISRNSQSVQAPVSSDTGVFFCLRLFATMKASDLGFYFLNLKVPFI